MHHHAEPESVIALIAAIRDRANTLILHALSERGVVDILPAHGAVLHALFRHGAVRMHELAGHIGRKKNTVTGLVATLEERGYCRREYDPRDARAQLVFLTEKGEAMRRIQDDVSAGLLRKVWGEMGEQEQAACVRSLETLLWNLSQDEPSTESTRSV